MNVKSVIPRRMKLRAMPILHAIRGASIKGSNRYCPVCKQSCSSFGPAGIVPRPDAQCGVCGSLERHRFAWLFLQSRAELFREPRGKMFLHIAPEPCLESALLRALGKAYLTADLCHPNAMIKMDITSIVYPDDSFDHIYCSHVLEHVKADRLALSEFYRVLRPGGWAVICVPIVAPVTEEDDSIDTPDAKLLHYGDPTHVRNYGPDFSDRLAEVGFSVQVLSPSDLFSDRERTRMGLTEATGDIYFCRK